MSVLDPALAWDNDFSPLLGNTPSFLLPVKSLCGGAGGVPSRDSRVPSSQMPQFGVVCVIFLSFSFLLGTGLARTGTNIVPR